MRKIISLFQRNYEGDRLVRDEVVPGAEWVTAGEGIATRKYDGTACMIQGGLFYKRYDAKKGKLPPERFIPAQDPDSTTGHWPGWIPVSDDPNDKWHREGFNSKQAAHPTGIENGTFELVGPKIQGNPERFDRHLLIRHGNHPLPDAPRCFNQLREYFRSSLMNIEGIVWHHSDGRMVKIKKRDFFGKR